MLASRALFTVILIITSTTSTSTGTTRPRRFYSWCLVINYVSWRLPESLPRAVDHFVSMPLDWDPQRPPPPPGVPPPALNPPAPTTGPPHVGETGVRDGPQRGVSRDASPFVPSTLATRKTVFSNREMSNDEGRDLGQSRCAEENEKFGSSIDIACPSTFLSTAPHLQFRPLTHLVGRCRCKACAIMTTASLDSSI